MLCLLVGTASADHLIVGTTPVAPFIVHNADGSWSGISMDLWKQIAQKRGYDYEVRELAATDLDDPQKMAAIDVYVSFSVSAKRAKSWDLTHAFYSTGVAIAVAPKPDDGLAGTLSQLFTARFAKLMAALAGVLLAVGVLMWLAERRRNEQFSGKAAHGIGAGMWWSAVTMTTVGYGDKAPVTFIGRMLGLVWMFAALLVVASFTASISSALTVKSLESGVTGPKDLPNARVGTVEPSSGAAYLRQRHISYHGYKDAAALVAGLAHGEIDAAIYDEPLLQYRVKSEPSLKMLEGTFSNHGYAFGLRKGSALREDIDLTLLEIIETDAWQQVLAGYL
ncbi:MAG: transporter substrate-binding domain-containing protein [Kofleriaceae bacterium]